MDLVEVLERRGELGHDGGRIGQIHPALVVGETPSICAV